MSESDHDPKEQNAASSDSGQFGAVGLILIIWANLIVFSIMALKYHSSEFTAQQVSDFGTKSFGQYWEILPSNYIHFSLSHLLFNMIALGLWGRPVCRRMGTLKFISFYTLCGFIASLVSLASHSDSTVTAGASGAVSGVFGALIVMKLLRHHSTEWSSIVTIIVTNAIIGYSSPQIDWQAHVSGLVAGGLFAFIFIPRYVIFISALAAASAGILLNQQGLSPREIIASFHSASPNETRQSEDGKRAPADQPGIVLPAVTIQPPIQSHVETTSTSERPEIELATFSAWSLVEKSGVDAARSISANKVLYLLVPPGSSHFRIGLGSSTKSDLPQTTLSQAVISFNPDPGQMAFTVYRHGDQLSIDLPDGSVKLFTHYITAEQLMSIKFNGFNDEFATFSLAGTSNVIGALAQKLQLEGVNNLPPPWSSGLKLSLPYSPRTAWTGTLATCGPNGATGECLRRQMVDGRADQQAIAFASISNFTRYLSNYGGEGKVSSGTVFDTSAANNSEQPVLLNGKQPYVDVWGLSNEIHFDFSHSTYAAAQLESLPPRLISASHISNGGQAFIYDIQFGHCHACLDAEFHETILIDGLGNIISNTADAVD